MGERSGIQIVAWAVAAILVVALGVKLLRSADPGGAPALPVKVRAAPSAGSQARDGVYVHVAGQVRRPGLYRLPARARVATALEHAGGTRRRAELSAVNLAARVQDGQQIVVPRTGAAPAAVGAPLGAPRTKISLATATAEQLDGLDGIGPTLAKRILEYRDSHGGFRSVEELREVEGIGEKRLEALKDAVQP